MTMQIILDALAKAIQGEPAPSFRTTEFRELLSAVTVLTSPSQRGNALALRATEQIGRAAMGLLLDRLAASMQSERALAVMRDNGDKPC